MNISNIETAIIDRLNARITGLSIEPYPENPSTYKLLAPVGAVLIRYDSSAYSAPQSTDSIVQNRTQQWEITLIMRNLHDKGGLHAAVDTVRKVLTGHKIAGCKKMYPTKDQFINEDNGIWQHGFMFAVPTKSVEDDDETVNNFQLNELTTRPHITSEVDV
ncbi:MAG TPA: Gp37 family protein [bacterium]|nr:Gp37 family protein [bacterium]